MTRNRWITGLSCLALASAAAATDAVLASGEHESGVKVELLEIKRDSPKVVTVRWRYRNETDSPKQLTKQRTGSIDAYRLALDTYLLDEDKKVKYPVSRDVDNHPVASKNGAANQYIVIRPKSTMDAWGKYFVPDTVETVSVVIDGVSPFGGIKVPR
jgi:hypothetical protein